MSNFQGGQVGDKFGQNQKNFAILSSIPRKSFIDRFSVKWQTNILEQFSDF
jgi:hypothetical protein